jgi:hypothetical protein
MKDYLSYRIMQQAGVAAPLASYTVLYINDTLWGLYLAVEDVNVSFLQRNFGQDAGQLYKPETQQLDMANAIPNADGDRPERQSDSDPSGNGRVHERSADGCAGKRADRNGRTDRTHS